MPPKEELKFKILGFQGDLEYDHLKETLIKALNNQKFTYQLDEVNEVDAILGYGLHTIPALVLEETILLQQDNFEVDEQTILQLIQNYKSSNGETA